MKRRGSGPFEPRLGARNEPLTGRRLDQWCCRNSARPAQSARTSPADRRRSRCPFVMLAVGLEIEGVPVPAVFELELMSGVGMVRPGEVTPGEVGRGEVASGTVIAPVL